MMLQVKILDVCARMPSVRMCVSRVCMYVLCAPRSCVRAHVFAHARVYILYTYMIICIMLYIATGKFSVCCLQFYSFTNESCMQRWSFLLKDVERMAQCVHGYKDISPNVAGR